MDPNTSPPAAAVDKHTQMLEHLSSAHSSRLQSSLTRRSSSSSAADDFLSRFAAAKSSITSALSLAPSLPPSSLPSHLLSVSASISDLSDLLALNSYLLTSYDTRSSLAAIQLLKDSLNQHNATLLPRKKFSFKNKRPATSPSPLTQTQLTAKPSQTFDFDSPGFRNKEGVTLIKNCRDTSGEFTLSDLSSCTVYMKGCVRSLFVSRVKGCKVYVGPVLGSILIDGAEGCLFMLAGHQIRIHEARGTDFYLRVRSRPIVEDCEGVRFAEYRLVYEGIEEELRESGLEEETGNWANVDDFKWLRGVQSPNWCILPEEERVGVVDATEFDEQGGDE